MSFTSGLIILMQGSTTLADAFIHTSYADMSDRLKSTSQTSLKEGMSH